MNMIDYDRLQLLINLIAEHRLRHPGLHSTAKDWQSIDDWARNLVRREAQGGERG
jgi:hypothetical protein